MEIFLYEVVNSIPNTVSGIVILIGILIGSRVKCGGKNDVISVCLDREAVTDILSIVYAVKLVTGGRTDYDYLSSVLGFLAGFFRSLTSFMPQPVMSLIVS